MGTQETIIYRLVVRNPGYDGYFSVLIFLATFGGKMGVATTRALMVWGLQIRPKSWPTGWTLDLLGQPLFRNHVFGIFRGKPPPLQLLEIIMETNFLKSNQIYCGS